MKDWFKALFGYTMGNILSVLSFVFAAAVFYTVFWLYGSGNGAGAVCDAYFRRNSFDCICSAFFLGIQKA